MPEGKPLGTLKFQGKPPPSTIKRSRDDATPVFGPAPDLAELFSEQLDAEYLIAGIETERGQAGLALSSDGNASLSAGLDRNAVAVLFTLKNREPALLNLDDIIVAASMSRDTATKALRLLFSHGLAHRPTGPRKGATVTDLGRKTAAQLSR